MRALDFAALCAARDERHDRARGPTTQGKERHDERRAAGPQQVPARAELLLAAELDEDAPGRPIYARLEPNGDGEPAGRIKVGVMLIRHLCARTPMELRTGLIVTLIGPATDGGRPLDRFLRVDAAWSNDSLGDVAFVTHAADRLSP